MELKIRHSASLGLIAIILLAGLAGFRLVNGAEQASAGTVDEGCTKDYPHFICQTSLSTSEKCLYPGFMRVPGRIARISLKASAYCWDSETNGQESTYSELLGCTFKSDGTCISKELLPLVQHFNKTICKPQKGDEQNNHINTFTGISSLQPSQITICGI